MRRPSSDSPQNTSQADQTFPGGSAESYVPKITLSTRGWQAFLARHYYRLNNLKLLVTFLINIILLSFTVSGGSNCVHGGNWTLLVLCMQLYVYALCGACPQCRYSHCLLSKPPSTTVYAPPHHHPLPLIQTPPSWHLIHPLHRVWRRYNLCGTHSIWGCCLPSTLYSPSCSSCPIGVWK